MRRNWPMGKTIGIWMTVLTLGAGCYPDDEQARYDGLRMPLSEWGVTLTAPAMNSWLDYLETFDADGSPAFDLNTVDQTFFMRLGLAGTQVTEETGILGQEITLVQEYGQEMLLVDLLLEDCQACQIQALVFFVEESAGKPGVFQTSTFVGATAHFNHPEDSLNNLQMDAYLEPTGQVEVTAPADSLGRSARAAVLFADENIRYPAKAFAANQTGEMQTVLPDLPILRDMDIQVDALGDGTWQTIARVQLLTAGQQMAVQVP